MPPPQQAGCNNSAEAHGDTLNIGIMGTYPSVVVGFTIQSNKGASKAAGRVPCLPLEKVAFRVGVLEYRKSTQQNVICRGYTLLSFSVKSSSYTSISPLTSGTVAF